MSDATLADISKLVEDLERLPDAHAREQARQLVRAVLDLHRRGLERVLELLAQRDGGPALVEELARDEAVAVLLSVHGLHPLGIDARVQSAVDEMRPQLLEQGVALELTAISDEAVKLRVSKAGPLRTNPATLRAQIERAIARDVPEISSVIIDGLDADVVPTTRLTGPRR